MNMEPLLDIKTKIRVSSVLNKDTKSYGKQYLVDQNEETCWNSDQGDKQWIIINFDENYVKINKIAIKFQGGFSSSLCNLECNLGNNITNEQTFNTKICELYPEDNNTEQVFNIDNEHDYSNTFRILFDKNTDLFGRIIIYNLQLYGTRR